MSQKSDTQDVFPALVFSPRTNSENLQPQILHASAQECALLSKQLHIPAIKTLSISYEGHSAEHFHFSGTIEACLVLTCAVSAEPFDHAITLDYNVNFVPQHELPALENDDLASEPLEPRGVANLSAFLIGLIALEIPAYPKASEMNALGTDAQGNAIVWADPLVQEEVKPNPFAALDQLGITALKSNKPQ